MAKRKKYIPIVRIGIDLDQTIVTEDGTLIPEGFDEFIRTQRKIRKRFLYLLGCFDEEVIPSLEKLGFFKSTDDGGLGFDKDDLHLCGSPEQRSSKIKELRLTHYIAGDADVFQIKNFSKRVQPILMSYMLSEECPTFADWNSIRDFLVWYRGLHRQTGKRLRTIVPIKETGENFVYQLIATDGSSYVLKRYYEKSGKDHHRLRTEVNHLKAIRRVGITAVPEPLWTDDEEWAIYDFIDGHEPAEMGDADVQQLADFLTDLDDKGESLLGANLPKAKDARLTLLDYVSAIGKLFNPVMSAVQAKGPTDIMLFMMTDMEQLRQDNINHFYLWCKREKWDREALLPEKERIFSPADFGFHNTLRTEDGKLVVFDFEYSGWDDPAKLMADFFYNTQQDLSMEHKLKVLDAFVKHRTWDKNFLNRFWAISDLVAIEWIVRTLQVTVPAEQQRLRVENPNLNIDKLVAERFAQAQEMRKNFQPMERLCKHGQLINESEIGK